MMDSGAVDEVDKGNKSSSSKVNRRRTRSSSKVSRSYPPLSFYKDSTESKMDRKICIPLSFYKTIVFYYPSLSKMDISLSNDETTLFLKKYPPLSFYFYKDSTASIPPGLRVNYIPPSSMPPTAVSKPSQPKLSFSFGSTSSDTTSSDSKSSFSFGSTSSDSKSESPPSESKSESKVSTGSQSSESKSEVTFDRFLSLSPESKSESKASIGSQSSESKSEVTFDRLMFMYTVVPWSLINMFIGNFQETAGAKSGWGAVIVAEVVALIAASTVHRVCITTCFLFSAVLLYEVNKLSGSAVSTSDSRTKKQSGGELNHFIGSILASSSTEKTFTVLYRRMVLRKYACQGFISEQLPCLAHSLYQKSRFSIVRDGQEVAIASSKSSENYTTTKKKKKGLSVASGEVSHEVSVAVLNGLQMLKQYRKISKTIPILWNILKVAKEPFDATLGNVVDDYAYGHWGNVVLKHLHQSFGSVDGGIGEAHIDPLSHRTRTEAKGYAPVMQNGSSSESHGHGGTEMCQRMLCEVLTSQMFNSLCETLFENFQGIKPESVVDFSVVISRMKQKTSEESPELFLSDIQQVAKELFDATLGNAADGYAYRHWGNVVLKHLHQSFGSVDGGIGEAQIDQIDRLSHRTRTEANGYASVMQNGSSSESHGHGVNEMCQRMLCEVLTSQMFNSLCETLFENFHGMKPESAVDFSVVISRMKQKIYEESPELFLSDIQQVWRKLQNTSNKIFAFSKSLIDLSTTSYAELVGSSEQSTFEDEKQVESDAHMKLEQKEKLDGTDCLVCDSCEKVYHLSCFEPAMKEIPHKSWYCADCTTSGIGSPHENCVVCVRFNGKKTPNKIIGDESLPTNEETFDEFEENSNSSYGGIQVSTRKGKTFYCRMCGNEVEVKGEKIRESGHPYCHTQYYHARCLTSKQLNIYSYAWYCPSCICQACLTNQDDDRIVLCDGCDHGYDIYCMKPPLDSIPQGKWFCRKCDAGLKAISQA
ncbi:hypothetical protein TSUD_310490 [Trifolium subterraneum]|uniref:PHD-type domain-containing protein n=1 Tax=Trifolium subterraneum TaxID=3900 RepID=A0A2Z6MQJ4_TRISU|nr:hypothetical protein TSUD_310490 [Trifolium subterraneum]